MTRFLKGNVSWTTHRSNDIFFNLCASNISLQVCLFTCISRACISSARPARCCFVQVKHLRSSVKSMQSLNLYFMYVQIILETIFPFLQ